MKFNVLKVFSSTESLKNINLGEGVHSFSKVSYSDKSYLINYLCNLKLSVINSQLTYRNMNTEVRLELTTLAFPMYYLPPDTSYPAHVGSVSAFRVN